MPGRPRNKEPSAQLRITIPDPIRDALTVMADIGLYGKNPPEVAAWIILEYFRNQLSEADLNQLLKKRFLPRETPPTETSEG